MGAWEVAMARMGPDYPLETFIDYMPVLAEGVVFPISLLDELASTGGRGNVVSSLLNEPSMENAGRIGEWLEARETKPEFDESYVLLTMAYSRNGDVETARKWADRVTASRLRVDAENAIVNPGK